jgi:hypothetical protein
VRFPSGRHLDVKLASLHLLIILLLCAVPQIRPRTDELLNAGRDCVESRLVDRAVKSVRDGAECAIGLPVRENPSESKARTTYEHAAALS